MKDLASVGVDRDLEHAFDGWIRPWGTVPTDGAFESIAKRSVVLNDMCRRRPRHPRTRNRAWRVAAVGAIRRSVSLTRGCWSVRNAAASSCCGRGSGARWRAIEQLPPVDYRISPWCLADPLRDLVGLVHQVEPHLVVAEGDERVVPLQVLPPEHLQ